MKPIDFIIWWEEIHLNNVLWSRQTFPYLKVTEDNETFYIYTTIVIPTPEWL